MAYYVVDENGEPVNLTPFEEREAAEEAARKWTEATCPEGSFGVARDEQDDETTDDTHTTMSYDFISGDEDQNDNNDEEQFNTVGNLWTLGNHSTASSDDRSELSKSIEETMAKLDDDIDGDMKAVLEDASDLVRDTQVSRFECPVEACGLGHSHSDHKHDIRSGFEVSNDFAEQMDFCPYCHCGVNELAMLMPFFPYISVPVFADQHRFEGVLEVEPHILNNLYRRVVQDNQSVNRAAALVADYFGVNEAEAVPLGVREDLKLFFQRRESIENAANSAPIADETRRVIEENREALDEATSQ